MRPDFHLVAAIQEDRHRPRRGAGPVRRPLWSMIGPAIVEGLRRDHSLTDYPCRLPDGRMGRVAAVERDGEWTLVCRAV
jgi:hypothetical protein